MAYVDANIFIFAIAKDAPQSDACLSILDAIVRGKISATTCALTWDEVIHAVKRNKGQAEAVAAGEALLAIPRLKIIPADRKTLALAQKICTTYRNSPRDSIHAACAILAGESEIYSFDSDFDKVGELKRKEPK
ncbi:MAG: type II toxin-antitoxin system VapC family toxin [Candidatus Micrarchaeia archaeon]